MDFIREKFNQISLLDNEIDEYYHRIAVNIGISDTAFPDPLRNQRNR